MKIQNKIKPLRCDSAVALGFFDGMHRGHVDVIANTITNHTLTPVVMTFSIDEQAPAQKSASAQILTDEMKFAQMEKLGVQQVVCPSFTQIRALSAQAFVHDVLKQTLRAKKVCCGYDFRFGKDAAGDVQTLQTLCGQYGIEVVVVDAVMLDGAPVSSTRIRAALQDGQIRQANELLGYRYPIEFTVVRGNQFGRTIGAATINQVYPSQLITPKFGVYATIAHVDGRQYRAVTNVGVKPTVAKQGVMPLAETHMIDFSGDLYGQHVRVEFVEFIRPEKKFDSLETLRAQIAKDRQTANEIIKHEILTFVR